MKKKLVAFAVTAAMVITSAVPALALGGWGEKPAVSGPDGNTIMLDSEGIETYDVAGSVDATGRNFETVVDLNYAESAYFTLSYKTADATGSVLLNFQYDGSTGTYNAYFEDNSAVAITGLDGIVTVKWTATNTGVKASVIQHGKSETPVKANNGKDYVESAVFTAPATELVSLKASATGEIPMYIEYPERIVGVTVAKEDPNGTIKIDGKTYTEVTEASYGDQLRVVSITLSNDTVINTFNGFPYATFTWSDDSQGLTYNVDETKDKGKKVNLTVTAYKPAGVFGTVTWGSADALASFDRFAGADRYETAMAIADEMGSKFDAVVVANGEDYADALSATALAKQVKAPVLLVNSAMEDEVAEYIKTKLNSYSSDVYVVGGEAAVSESFCDDLYKYDVERIAGADRYATNLAILEKLKELSAPVLEDKMTIMVCSGTNYPDALSASATGRAILLVGDELTADQIKWIADLKKANHFTVVGGNKVVSDNMVAAIALGDKDGKVDRLYGADRYETNEKVVNKYFAKIASDGKTYKYDELKSVVLASGNGFADALAGAAFAAQQTTGTPVLIVSDSNYERASNIVKRATNADIIVVGGEKSVSGELVQKIA